MKIFLSYASQDRPVADQINRALLEQGHDVFFDRDDLPAGEEFHIHIRRAVEHADLFVFLISPHALDAGSYTLNELDIAARRVAETSGRVLPVLLAPTAIERLPASLTSVTLLDSPGNIVAATADAVHRIAQSRRQKRVRVASAGVAVAALLATTVWWTRTSGPPTPERIGSDGGVGMLVPAGTFIMGSVDAPPRREVTLDAFYMDRYEVTTARYAKFLAASPSMPPPEGWSALDLTVIRELPVVNVDWNNANAYCTWAGGRLPTEAEWEKAARGADERPYPWGVASPDQERVNFENASPDSYGGGLDTVGSHPTGQSPYGVHDLAGNVHEWVSDWYADSVSTADSVNPRGPSRGALRTLRGGGRLEDRDGIASTIRHGVPPDLRRPDVGFRCAWSAR